MKQSTSGKQASGGILHVTYTYFPDPCGGTEVYVRGLAQRLSALGYWNAIAAPGAVPAAYEHAGLPVYRFATDLRPRLDLAYGVPDEIAAQGFRAIVEQIRPDIVHLHARTSAVSERLVDIGHAAGARVVFTYHTPTASCARGTMMLFGEKPCDGTVDTTRCLACTLAALGMPNALARAAALVPDSFYTWSTAITGTFRPFSALRIPGLIVSGRQRFLDFIGKVDRVVAVSEWVTDVLTRNGVPSSKITLSRQGISMPAQVPPRRASRGSRPLRIAYFGRIDRAKGPDLLARALQLIPKAFVKVDIFGIRQADGPDQVYDWLAVQAEQDPRLILRRAVAPGKVVDVMAHYDVIAVPSRWLETGPLVVLEAFAAGVPVLGSNLGGIAELVRDGVDGILVAPNDAAAWAAAIGRLVEDRNAIDTLRCRISSPRTVDAAGDDMAALYADILTRPIQCDRPQ